MNTKTLLVAVVALVIGLGGGYAIAENRSSDLDEQRFTQGTQNHDGSMKSEMHTSMSSMMAALEGKTGDAFDQAFLAGMIEHHEGAVSMANAALKYANHQEIKDLARNIVTTQTAEIMQMKEWQKKWYGK